MPDNTDLLDDDLRAVLGPGRCRDTSSQTPDTAGEEAPAKERVRTIYEPVDDSWAPAKPPADTMRRLRTCALAMLKYAAIGMGAFLAQQDGLCDPVIATPVTLLCAGLCGFSLGHMALKKG